NYGADYDDRKIPELIIANNLHGVDLDDRAVQLAQLGLYIKAKRKKRSGKIEHFNIVSSDFFLPAYSEVKQLFESEQPLSPDLEKIVIDLWADLQQAYKFGALIRMEEKFSLRLHGLVDKEAKDVTLFSESTLANYENFRENFFANLQKAVAQNTAKQGQTFLNTKTQDAITFLQVLTQKYDVAVANPPYTDSADFGAELKTFVDTNYRQPYKFNSNLYAAFIKRCYELTNELGYMGLIHPHTFMFIKAFEDVRKYLLENTFINIMVDYGQDRINLFDPSVSLDATFYVLSKNKIESNSTFIRIGNKYSEREKAELFLSVIKELEKGDTDIVFNINQSILKIIDGNPFIYWISEGFREKFKGDQLGFLLKAKKGLGTENLRFFRFWWEIKKEDISVNYSIDKKKWVGYVKGGPYKKWYGNLWLVINWDNNGQEIKALPSLNLRNPDTYLKEGIACSLLSSKGTSFRYQPLNYIYDSTTRSIFLELSPKYSLYVFLALLNSKVVSYILDCLNATVATNSDDIHRVPVVYINETIEKILSDTTKECIEIKKRINQYSIVEKEYNLSPLLDFCNSNLRERVLKYFNSENSLYCHILINEAVMNKLIFTAYNLSIEDCKMIEEKMGVSIGSLPVMSDARKAYLGETKFDIESVRAFVENLHEAFFEEEQIQSIVSEFISLYLTNNDLEEFCIRHMVNPINIWYWFKESRVLPQARAAEITLEFLADAFRTILLDDEDGIVPLVGLPGEPRLMDRFEAYCFSKDFTSAQIMQLEGLVGRPINEYVEYYFFNDLANLLNLFRHLPKTPFIWHLSSGEYQGFEAYIIIYKWNRDSLYKLKSSYLSKRTESLQYRLQQITDSTTGRAQTEKETIRLQLQEIEAFTTKIDELIAEGYNPKLDDGVGKNIAPLQAKGMLKAEVLKASGKNSQLQKYLNADW
ncbi:MAG TPA: Eco57I restriction-modification methylase domain-containing protein, partial [Flavitalea sp.]|nr:Eco57I restriction-modification methylase domain-containing protein [Flavitalea sp.]